MGEERNIKLWLFVITPLLIAFIITAVGYRNTPQAADKSPSLQPADTVLGEELLENDIGGGDFNIIGEQEREQAEKFPPVEYKEYKVQFGDNIWKIAKRFGVDWYSVLSVNKLKDANNIYQGQIIRIPNQVGKLHKVKPGETLEDIALMYDVEMSKIIGANRITKPDQIFAGAELFIPKEKFTPKEQEEIIASSNIPPTFMFPIQKKSGSGRVSSKFGYRIHPVYKKRMFHYGVDLTGKYGQKVFAARSGVVKHAGWLGGYGLLVVINHGGGFETRYAHCSSILVRKGQRVSQGQPIAKVGRTGRATGTHLHFEIRKNNEAIDPLKYIK